MNIEFKISNKKFKCSSYNTYQEKELLLLPSFCEDENKLLDEALKILNFKTKYKLSQNDKICILYKMREISVGDTINIRFTCPKCKKINEAQININNLFKEPILKSKYIEDTHDKPIFKGVDDLDIDIFEDLNNNIEKYITTFNFKKDVMCLMCRHHTQVDISNPKFVIENLSEESINSLYQTMYNLTYFSHFSLCDIEKMLPFERFIFNGLLIKTLEDKKHGTYS